jgi:hypothetical protein
MQRAKTLVIPQAQIVRFADHDSEPDRHRRGLFQPLGVVPKRKTPTEAASIEGDTNPPFLTPNDMASPLYLLAGDRQREPVRDVKWGEHFKRRPGLRQIPNSAVKCAAADLNQSGLKDALPWRFPFLFHFRLGVASGPLMR